MIIKQSSETACGRTELERSEVRRVRFKGSNGMFCLKYIIASAAFTPLNASLSLFAFDKEK